MNELADQTNSMADELPKKWGWLLALGILMIILGTIGMFVSVWVTLATVLVFGAFALAGGIFQLIQAFKAKEEKWAGRLPHCKRPTPPSSFLHKTQLFCWIFSLRRNVNNAF